VRRRAFSFAAGASLILFLATLVLWVRSYRAADGLSWSAGKRNNGHIFRTYEVLFDSGTVSFLVVDLPEENVQASGYLRWNVPELGTLVPTLPDSFWHRLKFEISRDKLPFGDGELVETLIRLPTWSLALSLCVSPLLWCSRRLRNRQRQRRLLAYRCVACSYDLTANTSGTCPECGAPVPPPAMTLETKSARPA